MRTILTVAIFVGLCVQMATCKREGNLHNVRRPEPTLEIAPLAQGRGQWRIATSDKIMLSVLAPGAESVRILDRPEGAEDEIELKTLSAIGNLGSGEFSADILVPQDFAGTLTAVVTYPDGTTKETPSIAITTATAIGPADTEFSQHITGGSVGTDESARSDKFTRGRIERTRLKTGDPNVRITVNAPAFQLTLWQNRREVSSYPIGIGRRDFPLPIGEREATAVIFNPRWIPPDSGWVRRTKGVEAFERIEPGDPRIPLGKVKIPLGDGYLIHEAAKPSDIGNLVSHGCIRMFTEDLFDLAKKIIAAHGLPVSGEEIESARLGSERLVLKLESSLLVDINYDPQVVEGGVLYLYPDIYDRDAFSLESLRAELQGSGVDPAKLDELMLKQLMGHISSQKQFAIRVADIKAGRIASGQERPLAADRVVNRGAKSEIKP